MTLVRGRVGLVAIVCAATPFAFGLIRAVTTGYDVRYLWLALASLGGATAVIAAARPSARRARTAIAVSAGVFVVATLCAIVVALLMGTTLGPGLLVVGAAFGFCFAVGSLFHLLERF